VWLENLFYCKGLIYGKLIINKTNRYFTMITIKYIVILIAWENITFLNSSNF